MVLKLTQVANKYQIEYEYFQYKGLQKYTRISIFCIKTNHLATLVRILHYPAKIYCHPWWPDTMVSAVASNKVFRVAVAKKL
jgi:hypothetical protein